MRPTSQQKFFEDVNLRSMDKEQERVQQQSQIINLNEYSADHLGKDKRQTAKI